MEEKIKKMIEENPLALATITKEGKPYVIAVAYVKVKQEKVVITNNYMRTTIENLKKNPNICLVVWNKEWEGYQISGKAEYYEKGEWYNFIKSLKENKEYPAKGAIIVKINKIKKLA